MCSIAGIVSNKEIDIKKMIVVQQHRSPDDSNYYVDNETNISNICPLFIVLSIS